MKRFSYLAATFMFIACASVQGFAQDEKESFGTHGKAHSSSSVTKPKVKRQSPKFGNTEKVTSSVVEEQTKRTIKSELQTTSGIKPEED